VSIRPSDRNAASIKKLREDWVPEGYTRVPDVDLERAGAS
jgi:hypothetical protein